MLKILVTYAVQGEFTEIKWPDVEVYYVRTGIGKVKAAFHLAEAIQQVKPDIVINQGTAGTINHQVGDVFVCRHFVDRDMHKMSGLGMECHIDSSELLAARGFCRHWTESATCNTGDSFLTELTDIEGDVVDMEAYAQAFVCRAKEIPFISVKYVGCDRAEFCEALARPAGRCSCGIVSLLQCFERKYMISHSYGYQEEEYFDPNQRNQEKNAIKHRAPH